MPTGVQAPMARVGLSAVDYSTTCENAGSESNAALDVGQESARPMPDVARKEV